MRRQLLLACALVPCTLAFGAASTTASRTADESTAATAVTALTAQREAATARAAAVAWLGQQIAAYRRTTWRWQNVMGLPLTETEGRRLVEMSIPDIQQAVRLWQQRASAVRRTAQHPPNLAAWLCIHRYEGSWTDGGGPYYGGLQMDLGFQRRYGGPLLRTKGTADHWTPLEQIWVAERARSAGRGFYPWPNTARACGLM